MPVLNDQSLFEIKIPNSHYGYSATTLDRLGATEYTVAVVACDVSGSTAEFTFDMESALTRIVEACKYSPRADNLLLRVTQFDTSIAEIHGFKLLENCDLADYGGVLRTGGSTALFDASENAISSITDFAGRLNASDFSVNGILFVITDGMDNASSLTAKTVKKALSQTVTDEALESLVSVLVGVNVKDKEVSRYLKDFHSSAGFTQYVEIEKADASTLAKLAQFVSRSISAQSQALGSGGSTPTLVF